MAQAMLAELGFLECRRTRNLKPDFKKYFEISKEDAQFYALKKQKHKLFKQKHNRKRPVSAKPKRNGAVAAAEGAAAAAAAAPTSAAAAAAAVSSAVATLPAVAAAIPSAAATAATSLSAAATPSAAAVSTPAAGVAAAAASPAAAAQSSEAGEESLRLPVIVDLTADSDSEDEVQFLEERRAGQQRPLVELSREEGPLHITTQRRRRGMWKPLQPAEAVNTGTTAAGDTSGGSASTWRHSASAATETGVAEWDALINEATTVVRCGRVGMAFSTTDYTEELYRKVCEEEAGF